MLKKAGIVVAAATAGLLAVAPLAFAGDKGDSDRGSDRGNDNASVRVVDVDSEYDGAACYMGNDAAVTNDNAGTSNSFSLLGAAANALSQVVAPVTAPIQAIAPIASCNNITFEDNSTDNDTSIQRSLNG
ncbi:hypothetical protein GCM10010464_25450 [Pseudonocardia yunnanensis]|uniref:Secreted protein n=1 Tax=Pseudonocardia yunnanensis TaxID=58107 RepID=A0ABW4F1V7_9PSEU